MNSIGASDNMVERVLIGGRRNRELLVPTSGTVRVHCSVFTHPCPVLEVMNKNGFSGCRVGRKSEVKHQGGAEPWLELSMSGAEPRGSLGTR